MVRKRDFWHQNIPLEDYKKNYKKLKNTLLNPRTEFIVSKFRFRRADGSYAQVIDKGNIIRNLQGKAVRTVGASSDISEIVTKEQANV